MSAAAATARAGTGDSVTLDMLDAAAREGSLAMSAQIKAGRNTPPENNFRNRWMRWAFDLGVRERVWLSYYGNLE